MDDNIKSTIENFLEICDELEKSITSRLPDSLRDIIKFDLLLFLLDLIPIDSDITEEHCCSINDILELDYSYGELECFYNSEEMMNNFKKEERELGVKFFYEFCKFSDEAWSHLNLLIYIYLSIGIQFLTENGFLKTGNIDSNSNYIRFTKKIINLVDNLKRSEDSIELQNKLEQIIVPIKNLIIREESVNSINNMENEHYEFSLSENKEKNFEDILEKMENKSVKTGVSVYNNKINEKDYFDILNEFELDENDFEYINEKLDENDILIVNEVNEESKEYKKIIDFVKNEIDSFPTIYIDDFEMVSNEFELSEKQKEELYSYMKLNYILCEDSRCVAALTEKIINVGVMMSMVSKEDYETIKASCAHSALEDLEDYVESNKVEILNKSFLNLLDLIELTSFILDNKISCEMLEDYIFEFNLTVTELEFLNTWIYRKEIEVFEDLRFPYGLSKNDNFLYEMYNQMEDSIEILNDVQIRNINQQVQKGDLFFLEKLRAVGFKVLLSVTKKYSDKAKFLYVLRDGLGLLDNLIDDYCSCNASNFYEFIASELEKTIKEIY